MKDDVYLIAGASGFIGRSLFEYLDLHGYKCKGFGRKSISHPKYYVCDLNDLKKLELLLQGVTTVINCSGYAHAFSSNSESLKRESWLCNYEGTKNLLEASLAAGVKKFIQISSVKVMASPGDACADEDWPEHPETEYGKSKLAAEKLLLKSAHEHQLDIVILRPAMVYGLGGRGNLDRMVSLVRKGFFPPLPETNNRRSMIYISDLIGAILAASSNPNSSGQIYIVANKEVLSGREIYTAIRDALGLKSIKFAIPRCVLSFIAKICEYIQALIKRPLPFNNDVLSRLLNSECYCSSKIEKDLNWKPRVDFKDGLEQLVLKNNISKMTAKDSKNIE